MNKKFIISSLVMFSSIWFSPMNCLSKTTTTISVSTDETITTHRPQNHSSDSRHYPYDDRRGDNHNDDYRRGGRHHIEDCPYYIEPHAIDEATFSFIYKNIKEEGFDDDRMHVVNVASLVGLYTCSQTTKIIKLFSHDRIEVLRIFTPLLFDIQNMDIIIESFTFLSEKENARKILLDELKMRAN